MTDEELIALARAAALKAYAPYSGFHVGCAVVSTRGEVVSGANLENACYRLGICAEQSALAAAQHAFGLDQIARIVVAGGTPGAHGLAGQQPVTPCGGCRQALLEAAQLSGHDIEILSASGDGRAMRRDTIRGLLPHGFGPEDLKDAD
ncbi:MAG: Cytidine deaminase [uncultured Sphingomonas sp.]|uniref:Cytidine deaminase n=1 Tax=uncultured Sphingomonas sp. TaxID=158754 RepID=A0A6J4SSE4_9SPHN|nr:cytidine deaminase [uncultured Sphingomonas sp.]CAA9503999.1 MAG: Cytidine deaminase [uncultured Sphingomonas sp.]